MTTKPQPNVMIGKKIEGLTRVKIILLGTSANLNFTQTVSQSKKKKEKGS